MAMVWVPGCCRHAFEEGRIMGRHRARSRVTDGCIPATGTLSAVSLNLCLAFLCIFAITTLCSRFRIERREVRALTRVIMLCSWAPRSING